jgi:site-specific DNA-methyltransferase (adenine-specific)
MTFTMVQPREGVTLYCGDCLEVLPTLVAGSVDAVVTDPPYPDQHLEYGDISLELLTTLACRQLIFWSARASFPLDYTAIHIWDKLVGCASEYERIFERNGARNWKVFRAYVMNSTVAAAFGQDERVAHPSQKPIKLLRNLVRLVTELESVTLDPFMGSGTTGVACVQTGRKFIGVEIERKYFDIAVRRITEAQAPLPGMVTHENEKMEAV